MIVHLLESVLSDVYIYKQQMLTVENS